MVEDGVELDVGRLEGILLGELDLETHFPALVRRSFLRGRERDGYQSRREVAGPVHEVQLALAETVGGGDDARHRRVIQLFHFLIRLHLPKLYGLEPLDRIRFVLAYHYYIEVERFIAIYSSMTRRG